MADDPSKTCAKPSITPSNENPFDKILAKLKPMPDDKIAEADAATAQRAKVLRVRELASDLGLRYSPERANLDAYQVYDSRQKDAVRQLVDFLASNHAGRNLILFGTVGTGKDHLLAAALYMACSCASCRWVNGQELYGSVRDRMGDDGESEGEWFSRWMKPDILGISDPVQPVGELNAWRMELLYRLVDRRYRAMKATWVTLNVRSKEEADDKLSQQVFDRLQDGATMIPCFWPSYRARLKK